MSSYQRHVHRTGDLLVIEGKAEQREAETVRERDRDRSRGRRRDTDLHEVSVKEWGSGLHAPG